jgi:hypothetical protein
MPTETLTSAASSSCRPSSTSHILEAVGCCLGAERVTAIGHLPLFQDLEGCAVQWKDRTQQAGLGWAKLGQCPQQTKNIVSKRF